MKPISKSKLNLQICISGILILFLLFTGVVDIVEKIIGNRNLFGPLYIGLLVHLGWLLLIGFLIMLLKNFQGVKISLIILLIIKTVDFLFTMARVGRSFTRSQYQIISEIDGFLSIAVLFTQCVFVGLAFGEKFKNDPLFKHLRPFAAVWIITTLITVFLSMISAFNSMLAHLVKELWFIVYFIQIIPLIFLILYYIKLKSIHSTMIANPHDLEKDKNWPPPTN